MVQQHSSLLLDFLKEIRIAITVISTGFNQKHSKSFTGIKQRLSVLSK